MVEETRWTKKSSAVGKSFLSSILCAWQGRDLRPETLGHHIPANRWTNRRSCKKWSGAEVSDGLTVQLHAFDHKSGWLWPEFDLRRSRHHPGSCMEPSCRHAGSGSGASDWSRAWSEDISADHEWPHWGVGHYYTHWLSRIGERWGFYVRLFFPPFFHTVRFLTFFRIEMNLRLSKIRVCTLLARLVACSVSLQIWWKFMFQQRTCCKVWTKSRTRCFAYKFSRWVWPRPPWRPNSNNGSSGGRQNLGVILLRKQRLDE